MDNLGFGSDLSCTKTDIGPTRVEINLDNIAYNIQQIGRNATPELKIMAVVKADGYGHGAVQVARVAARRGVEWLGVAKLEEGVQLRESGIQSPILILGLSRPPQAQEILKYRLSQTVYTRELARALSAQAGRLGQTAKVHVELDTGMGRAGVMPEEATSFFKEISHLQGIKVEGAFTHFSVADKKDKSFTELQIKRFNETIANLEKEGIPIPLKHAANSAATLDIPSSY
ncbi:alanine racemase, partial [Candidatus Aerophobetes bacterium]|nr:alanine racemase [Candidatus Aerophobetes bacterium]